MSESRSRNNDASILNLRWWNNTPSGGQTFFCTRILAGTLYLWHAFFLARFLAANILAGTLSYGHTVLCTRILAGRFLTGTLPYGHAFLRARFLAGTLS